jgi:3-dehydroshikimate dehydratase
MKTGVCSITFRQLSVREIPDLVRRAGLDAIEWGGDIHVPPGDIAAAETALRCTREAGLEVSSYGSYYKIIDPEGSPEPFEPVLESALALGTDTIRIWAGTRPSEAVDAACRERLVQHLRSNLDAAAACGIRLALEFHVNSLTDSNSAALALLAEVSHPNLYTYWQPIYWLADPGYRLEGLQALRSRVLNLHVFHWIFHPMRGGWGENTERRPLCEGAAEWKRFLSVPLETGSHFALIEFVAGNDPEQFLKDSSVLMQWIESADRS